MRDTPRLAASERDAGTSVPAISRPEMTAFRIPEGDYETLAGFMLSRFERVPQVGDQTAFNGWELKVVSMERNRISEVLLVSPPGEDDDR